jgi:hypothetical protein
MAKLGAARHGEVYFQKAINMNTELALSEEQGAAITPPETPKNGSPHPDAKALRTEHVGALLASAYQKASDLKITREESKKLREDFPDSAVEIRPFDGIVYISHMALRERLWEVFGCGHVAEICRERFMRQDTNEVAVDLVLMIRGAFVAEGVGTAKYIASNAKTSFGDVVESAWSEALRRCCKKFGVGTQVWRPGYIREWLAANAIQQGGKWLRRDDPRALTPEPTRKTRDYTLKEPPSEFAKIKAAVQATTEESDDVPF